MFVLADSLIIAVWHMPEARDTVSYTLYAPIISSNTLSQQLQDFQSRCTTARPGMHDINMLKTTSDDNRCIYELVALLNAMTTPQDSRCCPSLLMPFIQKHI